MRYQIIASGLIGLLIGTGFGYTLNGYLIYRGFYDREGKQMVDIAEQLNGNHSKGTKK